MDVEIDCIQLSNNGGGGGGYGETNERNLSIGSFYCIALSTSLLLLMPAIRCERRENKGADRGRQCQWFDANHIAVGSVLMAHVERERTKTDTNLMKTVALPDHDFIEVFQFCSRKETTAIYCFDNELI